MVCINNKKIALSKKKKYCEGYWNSCYSGYYVLGLCLGTSITKIKFSHCGSSTLDEINAFDLAEIKEANIGQINMIKVSSFCGPKGLIWGYDICKSNKKNPLFLGHDILSIIPTYDISPLTGAFTRLVGTIDYPRFPILPGSHVPCAVKYITKKGKAIIYCAIGLGIAANREDKACLLMEDIGTIPFSVQNKGVYIDTILRKLALSVLEVGRNQKIKFKELFLGIKCIIIEQGEIGCALVASPYLSIAQEAYNPEIDYFSVTIDEWEKNISNRFLCNKKLLSK
jgi:histidine decarboxylase